MVTGDAERIEAPITLRGSLICAFAAFGGIFFGYDLGYLNGVLGMPYFIQLYTGLDPATTAPSMFTLSARDKSLMVSILSAGTFFGSIMAGDCADFFGRRTTIIFGCMVFCVGAILQTASTTLGLFVAGRLVTGFGIGSVSAIVVLYMSEISPKKIRGAIVAVYGFFISVGVLIASCVDYGTKANTNTSSYRIPIAIQMLWALILAVGLWVLPESPRYYVKKGMLDRAAASLVQLRRQPLESDFVKNELTEIVANHEYELQVVPQTTYIASWTNCFKGGLQKPSSNLRRTIVGMSMLAIQQWTGPVFIFYFGITFFQELGTIKNPFLIGIITTLINVCSSTISFWTFDRFGRRAVLVWGLIGMMTCQFIVGIIGTTAGQNHSAVSALIAFICFYIFCYAQSWGAGPWIVIGETFPLPIRSRGVGLSAASNWFWNCVSLEFLLSYLTNQYVQIISVIIPYMLGVDQGNLGAKVFFIWGSLCIVGLVFVYFLVPETKGLSLEQVDRMLEETSPRHSSKWLPHSTFAADMGMTEKSNVEEVENVADKSFQEAVRAVSA